MRDSLDREFSCPFEFGSPGGGGENLKPRRWIGPLGSGGGIRLASSSSSEEPLRSVGERQATLTSGRAVGRFRFPSGLRTSFYVALQDLTPNPDRWKVCGEQMFCINALSNRHQSRTRILASRPLFHYAGGLQTSRGTGVQ